ncbi:unnamed protein product [Lactuca saligna]|uniref:Uncharacterized protein n=1 Tax=Lactuca saligna TaxID=75948 RepID=A0AA35UKS3_LACSI|nr:unnamed protein product [Lactuca saligna]
MVQHTRTHQSSAQSLIPVIKCCMKEYCLVEEDHHSLIPVRRQISTSIRQLDGNLYVLQTSRTTRGLLAQRWWYQVLSSLHDVEGSSPLADRMEYYLNGIDVDLWRLIEKGPSYAHCLETDGITVATEDMIFLANKQKANDKICLCELHRALPQVVYYCI